MTFLSRILLASFAGFRLVELFVYDDGPFDVFKRFRIFIMERASDGGSLDKNLYKLFTCPHCLGLWIAIFVSMFVLWHTTMSDVFLLILGIAGAISALSYLKE